MLGWENRGLVAPVGAVSLVARPRQRRRTLLVLYGSSGVSPQRSSLEMRGTPSEIPLSPQGLRRRSGDGSQCFSQGRFSKVFRVLTPPGFLPSLPCRVLGVSWFLNRPWTGLLARANLRFSIHTDPSNFSCQNTGSVAFSRCRPFGGRTRSRGSCRRPF